MRRSWSAGSAQLCRRRQPTEQPAWWEWRHAHNAKLRMRLCCSPPCHCVVRQNAVVPREERKKTPASQQRLCSAQSSFACANSCRRPRGTPRAFAHRRLSFSEFLPTHRTFSAVSAFFHAAFPKLRTSLSHRRYGAKAAHGHSPLERISTQVKRQRVWCDGDMKEGPGKNGMTRPLPAFSGAMLCCRRERWRRKKNGRGQM